MKPNLFNYATSELSQDAVLCWLTAWSGPHQSVYDPLLHDLGTRFVHATFHACRMKPPSAIDEVKVHRQYKNIDILVRINETTAVELRRKLTRDLH